MRLVLTGRTEEAAVASEVPVRSQPDVLTLDLVVAAEVVVEGVGVLLCARHAVDQAALRIPGGRYFRTAFTRLLEFLFLYHAACIHLCYLESLDNNLVLVILGLAYSI